MDRSWMGKERTSPEYRQGVIQFLNLAFSKSSNNGKILCPCKKCVNTVWKISDEVYGDLVCYGFLPNYSRWFCHGESLVESQTYDDNVMHEDQGINDIHDMHNMIHDMFGMHDDEEESDDENMGDEQSNQGPNIEAETFYKLMKDADQGLCPGSKNYSKLSFIVHLFHIKCMCGWSNKSMSILLALLTNAFPLDESFPKSTYQIKSYIGKLGLGYQKIHACPNRCMLFWKDKENEELYPSCLICKASRWQAGENDESSSTSKRKKKPAKVLRYFPLKPRLQRLFMSSKTASSMRWHEEGRVKDGGIRHPADSLAWKSFDSRYPGFSLDPRNVRLGLATDGFNPFRTMSITHSTWPIMLIPYNGETSKTMKQSNFILSTLIPGPKGPGMNIDVYLQPVIEELKELWEIGVETYDVSKDETFNMRASLLWTISDFPAYAYLSGWSTSGKFACPTCNYDTPSTYLKHSRKHAYHGFRRCLDPNHPFRFDKRSFDGNCDFDSAPASPSGSTVLNWWNENVEASAGENQPLKKKSIFFDLPYWEYNLIHHNLDVMHIEKNVCDNLLGTLLNLEGKTKDHLKARLDLQEMGIRSELHPEDRGSGKTYIPPACFTMSRKEKQEFLQFLKDIKVPDGYASNISRCVHPDQLKIFGLKSHDGHILMQQLLGLAVRGLLPEHVAKVVIEFCNIFRELCSKVLYMDDLEKLESRVVVTLCRMQKIFPPSFFNVMVHLVVHLVSEAKIAGPVFFRWMYPVERYLSTLKDYVGNRAYPEGSIAEGYLAQECLTFCSRYLSGVETSFNRPLRNGDSGDNISRQGTLIFNLGHPIGGEKIISLDKKTWIQAHRYVLFNSDLVTPYLKEHVSVIKRSQRKRRLTPNQIETLHSEQFHEWFQTHVNYMERENGEVSDELKWLARGPNFVAKSFSGLNINGIKFHTKKRAERLKTQNCGVVNLSNMSSYATSKDLLPVTGDVTYYGLLTNIIELNYYDKFKVMLFKCDWADVEKSKGKKEDEFGYTLVNFSKLIHIGERLLDDPFILASQAQQVFYVRDQRDKGWHVVIRTQPRDVYDMGEEECDSSAACCMDQLPCNMSMNISCEIPGGLVRSDIEGTSFDNNSSKDNESFENDTSCNLFELDGFDDN